MREALQCSRQRGRAVSPAHSEAVRGVDARGGCPQGKQHAGHRHWAEARGCPGGRLTGRRSGLLKVTWALGPPRDSAHQGFRGVAWIWVPEPLSPLLTFPAHKWKNLNDSALGPACVQRPLWVSYRLLGNERSASAVLLDANGRKKRVFPTPSSSPKR